MKPTRNQLLSALGYSLDEPVPDSHIANRAIDQFDGPYPEKVLRALIKSRWTIVCEVNSPRPEDKVQVPVSLAPTTVDQCLAFAWLLDESHSCTLVPFDDSPCLLRQCLEKGVVINTYTPTGRFSKADGRPLVTLDPECVLLAFELAGLPAPKNYHNWREPDGDSVPTTATIDFMLDYGTATVHYHDGQSVLISSIDGRRTAVVSVTSLESAASEVIKGLVKTNTEKKSKRDSAGITQAEAERLVAKYYNF